MKTLTAAALLLAALVPAVASAQAAEPLGSPVPEAPASYDEQLEVPPAPVPVDPEIVQLRGGDLSLPPGPSQPTLPAGPDRAEPARTGGPSFGSSWGHAWGGFGIGTGVGALAGGAVAAAATCGGSDGFLCPLMFMSGAALGAMTVSPFGAALATWGFGERNGGTGNFFAALGGSYLGAGLGVGVSALLVHAGGDASVYASVIGPVVGILGMTLGAAAGYQLTSRGDDSEAQASGSDAQASTGPTILPTFDVSDTGATAGVAGTF